MTLSLFKLGAASQASISSFTEQGVLVTSGDYLTAPAVMSADAEKNLFFASFSTSYSAARQRILSWDGISASELIDSFLYTADIHTDAGQVITGTTSAFSSGDRVHVLWSTEINAGNLTMTLSVWDETNGWQTDTDFTGGATTVQWNTQGVGAYRIFNRNDGTNHNFIGTCYRVALWTGLTTAPDVTNSAVRSNFVDGTSIVDPTVSHSAYGTSNIEFDCYGPASTWNSGSFTYGPTFTVNGTFADA